VERTSWWSPAFYAGEGALRRSGKRSALIARFSAGDRNNPGLEAHFKIDPFPLDWSPAPPAEAGGLPPKASPPSFFAACEAASVKQGGSPKLSSELYVTDKAGRLHL